MLETHQVKRYESFTMLVVTTSEYTHRGDRAAHTAECYKVAHLVDPQDLDRGVDPDDDHGLTHHSSVMVHVDPPPPPEPPPRIHHPPSCRIDLVNQDPSLKFVKIEFYRLHGTSMCGWIRSKLLRWLQ
jgi:hypothetical protein